MVKATSRAARTSPAAKNRRKHLMTMAKEDPQQIEFLIVIQT